MSRSLKQKKYLVFALGLTLGFAAAYFFNAKHSGSTTLSSLDESAKQKTFLKNQSKEQSKSFSFMSISINPTTEVPIYADESITLVGDIKPLRNFASSIEYKWILPNGVQIKEGNIEGIISQEMLSSNQNQINLTVTGFSQEDAQLITLQAFAYEGSTKMSNSASITSLPTESFEMLAENSNDQKMKNESLLKRSPTTNRTLSGEIQR